MGGGHGSPWWAALAWGGLVTRAGPNTRFQLTAAPVALWAAGVTEAQPQVKRAVQAALPPERPAVHP